MAGFHSPETKMYNAESPGYKDRRQNISTLFSPDHDRIHPRGVFGLRLGQGSLKKDLVYSTSGFLTNYIKWFLSFAMMAGRLEVCTVLVLLTPRFRRAKSHHRPANPTNRRRISTTPWVSNIYIATGAAL